MEAFLQARLITLLQAVQRLQTHMDSYPRILPICLSVAVHIQVQKQAVRMPLGEILAIQKPNT